MIREFKIGETVRVNPSLFPEDVVDTNHYGILGMPGIFRNTKFMITGEVFEHNNGTRTFKLSKVKAVDDPRFKAEFYMAHEELVPAVMKVTLDYKVFDDAQSKAVLVNEINRLKSERVSLKQRGFKIGGSLLKSNFAAIEKAKKSLASLPTKKLVHVPKIKQTFEISPELASNQKELESFLTGKVREWRSKLKSKPLAVEKKVWGRYDVKLVGGVHEKPNVYGDILEHSLKSFIKENKVPSDPNSNYLGIEVECLIRCSREELETQLIKARLHRNTQLVSDSSIRVDQEGYQGVEIRVLATEQELASVMARLGKILNSRKVDAYANRSCGLHVHLDMRNRDRDVMYKRLFNVQSLMRKCQPASRLTSKYCKKTSGKTFDEASEINERYSAINVQSYEKHKTIEIRIHEGTTDCDSINSWCKFLVGVLNSDIKSPIADITRLERMENAVDASAIAYVKTRIAKFGEDEEVA